MGVGNRILRRRRFCPRRSTSAVGNCTDRLRIWPSDERGIADALGTDRLAVDIQLRPGSDDVEAAGRPVQRARQERNGLHGGRSKGTVADDNAEMERRRISRRDANDAKRRGMDRWRNDIEGTGIDRTFGSCVQECNVDQFGTNPDDNRLQGNCIPNEDARNCPDHRAICTRIRCAVWEGRISGMV